MVIEATFFETKRGKKWFINNGPKILLKT